ncbi:MAG: RIP metalloprotease RseP [Deltaproteobacteria bacterium]|nr:RIP metalloprotease RseP [Deltaproteobacteria bacterium]
MTLLHFLVPFLVLLGILIFVHELGHFLVAKRLGIRVLKFSLGFGPRIFGWQRGDTEYAVSAVPLGGYVKLYGEDPDEELPPEDRAASFSARGVGHRLATVAAGPSMNLLLAVVVFSVLSFFGTPVLLPVVGEVSSGMPAAGAGLQPGDRISAVNGRAVGSWDEMAEAIGSSSGRELGLTVHRGAETLTVRVQPTRREAKNLFGEVEERPVIGISPSGAVENQRSPAWMAPWIGLRETGRWTWMTLEVLGKMAAGRVSPRTLGGPIAIAKMAGDTAQTGPLNFLFLIAILSVNLAVLNLLPIPVLDGGHLFFFLVEAVRGRPVSVKFREAAQQVGLMILLLLMAFVMYNDVARLMAG